MVEEEVGRGVFNVYIIAESIVPAITGNTADRLEAGATLVFQLHKVHRTVYTNGQTGNNFITYCENGL